MHNESKKLAVLMKFIVIESSLYYNVYTLVPPKENET